MPEFLMLDINLTIRSLPTDVRFIQRQEKKFLHSNVFLQYCVYGIGILDKINKLN